MTAAQFVNGFTSHASPFVDLARPRDWLVRFRFSLKGEAPEIARETVKGVTCEAVAIRDALAKRLGAENRPLRSLELLEVCAL